MMALHKGTMYNDPFNNTLNRKAPDAKRYYSCHGDMEGASQAESCMPQMETSSYKRWVLVSDYNLSLIFFINIIKEYSILLYE